MKLAYRILTPIFAIGALALGLFLKFFSVTIGSQNETIDQLITGIFYRLLQRMPTFEFSLFEMISAGIKSMSNAESGQAVADALSVIRPHLIAFFVLLILVALLLIGIAVVGALANSKKRRNAVIFMSLGAMALSMAAIFVSNAAFKKMGDVDLYGFLPTVLPQFLSPEWADKIGALLSNETIANLGSGIVNAIICIKSSALSAGFFAIFGMLILIIFWTVLTNYIIKSPIQFKKKHRRKKPMRSPFASKKS